jgi:hypothetical protein
MFGGCHPPLLQGLQVLRPPLQLYRSHDLFFPMSPPGLIKTGEALQAPARQAAQASPVKLRIEPAQ